MNKTGLVKCRLIGQCTLKGAQYGLIGGAITGLPIYVVGALYGGVIGLFLGLLFGVVNGASILAFARYGRGDLSLEAYKRDLQVCCILTSILLDGAIIGLVYFIMQAYILLILFLIALPAIIVSAWCGARYIGDWYPRQVDITPVEYVVEESVDVWPPAPKHDS